MLRNLALFALLAVSGVFADRKYIIKNSCPSAVKLYINGEAQGSIPASGGSFGRTFPDTWSGFIYTDANGGNKSGAGTTRAGFYGQSGYYYMVVDPAYFNVGVKITPDRAPSSGFCVPAACTALTCPTAFQQPPTRFPPPGKTPPAPPVYGCPQANTGYTVEFCPGGAFPTLPGIALHPKGNTKKCLDVRGANYTSGTPVQIYDCNGTQAQKWLIQRGDTRVQLAGTEFCLDAGIAPANGVPMKIWKCDGKLAAQAWYWTNDNRIAVTGTGQCLDVTNGTMSNSNPVQIWKCTDNNTNQVWTA
ncbi:hypothetical protein H0H81_003996 [Sphagnurus paluster]|uniref:Ricin B lectin domain-containing protein n=1 Tax=Sphagnurus paluster TaxID=117069 RepID=A0A9P7K5Z7_9AGAR|nr:hypothetical protein H0H81_003996 [Sphagnurus paluster]